jgi:prolyl-tRNA editing enzyme YbaK/EbsC (Cys-tRNA(Pro) deacylase)
VSLPHVGAFDVRPALECLGLLPGTVGAALQAWAAVEPRVAAEAGVIEIDPADSDTAALVGKFGLDWDLAANCVLVAGRRAGEERVAAVLVRADTKADVNGAVRRLLDVRKASFMPMEQAVSGSGMEYGAITPVGVPAAWRILVDSGVVTRGDALVGAGTRGAKLVVPGELFAALPRAEVVEGLAR